MRRRVILTSDIAIVLSNESHNTDVLLWNFSCVVVVEMGALRCYQANCLKQCGSLALLFKHFAELFGGCIGNLRFGMKEYSMAGYRNFSS